MDGGDETRSALSPLPPPIPRLPSQGVTATGKQPAKGRKTTLATDGKRQTAAATGEKPKKRKVAAIRLPKPRAVPIDLPPPPSS
jgi:hypothetical protein